MAQRPKIRIRSMIIPVHIDKTSRGAFIVVNGGYSNAVITDASCTIVPTRTGRPPDLTPRTRTPSGNLRQDCPITLASGEEGTFDIPEFTWPDDIWSDFETRRETSKKNRTTSWTYGASIEVYVIGYIAYTDQLNAFRRTYFCRQFNFLTEAFVPVDDPNYEYEA